MDALRADTPLRRSVATWALLALTSLITAFPVVSAVRSLLIAVGVMSVELPDEVRRPLAAAALACSPGVATDFERPRLRKELRERHAAEAARRAGSASADEDGPSQVSRHSRGNWS